MVEPSLKDGIVSIPGSLLVGTRPLRKYILTRVACGAQKRMDRVRPKGRPFPCLVSSRNLYAECRDLKMCRRFLDELGIMVATET